MSDTTILYVGVVVFGLMVIALILTIREFQQIPRYQKPEFKNVAAQAQPEPPDDSRENPGG